MDSSLRSSSWVSFPFMLAPNRVSNENRQEFCYLQNEGGLELASMENATSFLSTFASNPPLLSAIFALFLTQSTKVCFRLFFASQGMPSTRSASASQGMPSTRSALCSALTTSIALTHGVAGSLFPLSLGFSLILMCDAVALRKHVGYQAFVVNAILDQLLTETPKPDEKIDEDVGHTLPQLLAGALLGSTAAILCSLGFMLLR